MALGGGLYVKLHPDGDMYGSMTHAQGYEYGYVRQVPC